MAGGGRGGLLGAVRGAALSLPSGGPGGAAGGRGAPVLAPDGAGGEYPVDPHAAPPPRPATEEGEEGEEGGREDGEDRDGGGGGGAGPRSGNDNAGAPAPFAQLLSAGQRGRPPSASISGGKLLKVKLPKLPKPPKQPKQPKPPKEKKERVKAAAKGPKVRAPSPPTPESSDLDSDLEKRPAWAFGVGGRPLPRGFSREEVPTTEDRPAGPSRALFARCKHGKVKVNAMTPALRFVAGRHGGCRPEWRALRRQPGENPGDHRERLREALGFGKPRGIAVLRAQAEARGETPPPVGVPLDRARFPEPVPKPRKYARGAYNKRSSGGGGGGAKKRRKLQGAGGAGGNKTPSSRGGSMSYDGGRASSYGDGEEAEEEGSFYTDDDEYEDDEGDDGGGGGEGPSNAVAAARQQQGQGRQTTDPGRSSAQPSSAGESYGAAPRGERYDDDEDDEDEEEEEEEEEEGDEATPTPSRSRSRSPSKVPSS